MKITASHLAKCLLPIVGAVGFAGPALATTGTTYGYVKNTYLPSSTNAMDYRITIGDPSTNGTQTVCNGKTFAYINQSDPNFTLLAKTITYLRGIGVDLNVDWSVDGAGYCHITDVSGGTTAYYDRAGGGAGSLSQGILGLFVFFINTPFLNN